MKSGRYRVLTINCGSSSIKFALYEMESLKELFCGEMKNIGTQKTKFNFSNSITAQYKSTDIQAADHDAAADFLIGFLDRQENSVPFNAIGHRVVHGMEHTQPEIITVELLDELKKISAYDPEHLPGEIKLIEAFGKHYPSLLQIACFDTSFHTSMPLVAKLLPIPHRYYANGIRRYGFHGLSYNYLLEELVRTAGNEAAKGKLIMAHLGSGASLVAVKDGKSVDTSMGFTPTSGLPMSTRTGDLDPGVAWYFMESEKMGPAKFNHLINHESGLLGISETSSDMQDLLMRRPTDDRAAEAVDFFCYETKKWIGSFTAVLGGLNTLLFSGGIGENSPEVRTQICDGLEFMGIELDEIKNRNNEKIISKATSKVFVRVIKTNEQLMIAKLVYGILNYSN